MDKVHDTLDMSVLIREQSSLASSQHSGRRHAPNLSCLVLIARRHDSESLKVLESGNGFHESSLPPDRTLEQ